MTETTETDEFTVERPPTHTQALLMALRELYHENPDAESMDRDEAITRAVENVERLSRPNAEHALDTLLRRGECYRPHEGELRLTTPPDVEA